jgi:hypothetical protein
VTAQVERLRKECVLAHVEEPARVVLKIAASVSETVSPSNALLPVSIS